MDDPGFAAAIIVPDAAAAPERSACSVGSGRMEIVVGNVRILVDASVDGAALARVVDVIGRR
jgi:hypothetical protein